MDDIVERLASAAAALDGEHMRTCLDAIDAITALRHAARDCADDLAGHVEREHQGWQSYPSIRRRYDRDMAPVLRARALLDTATTAGKE